MPLAGGGLRVRRPNDYSPAAAAVLGPTDPDPGVDAVRLGAVRTRVPDSPAKLFVGGLPCDWGADRVKALLAPCGRLAAFSLVMDKDTGNSKGWEGGEGGREGGVWGWRGGRSPPSSFLPLPLLPSATPFASLPTRPPPTTASRPCTARRRGRKRSRSGARWGRRAAAREAPSPHPRVPLPHAPHPAKVAPPHPTPLRWHHPTPLLRWRPGRRARPRAAAVARACGAPEHPPPPPKPFPTP